MSHFSIRRLTAWGALAVICLAPQVASAYPIQNVTKTLVDKSQGEIVNIYGSIAGGTSPKGTKMRAGGLFTQAESMNLKQQTVSQGNVLFADGAVVRTYSMELTGTLQSDKNINTRIESVPPAGALEALNKSTYVANSGFAVQRAAWVVSNFGQGNITAQQSAAVQIAVWSIMYQAGVDARGNVYKGSAFNVGTVETATGNLANEYLKLSWNKGAYKTASGVLLRQGVNFNRTVNSAKGQDLLYAKAPELLIATPEPSTLAIAGLGGLGLLGYRSRRRPTRA